MRIQLISAILMVSTFSCKAQEKNPDTQLNKESIAYKKIGDTFLTLDLFASGKKEKKPVIVFFHPGGWVSGSPSFFYEKALKFSILGYNTICVQYRLANLKSTTPKDCLDDSMDALKYLNRNREKLNLDMSNLFLVGYSAGGHLALMSQLSNDPKIPVARKIFIIASPVDLLEDELLKTSEMTDLEKEEISPINHIQNLKTKLYLFYGTNDEYVNFSTILDFMYKGKQLNKNVSLKTFKNTGHFLLTTAHKEKIEHIINKEITED